MLSPALAEPQSGLVSQAPLFQAGKYRILALVFDDYETLDLHGPIEMLGHMPNAEIKLVAAKDVVRSYQGPRVVADCLTNALYECDLFIIPGGLGTRTLVNDAALINWMERQVALSQSVFTICTGTALIAKTKVMNGLKATTNKMAYPWVTSLNEHIVWQPKARWVDDGKFLTSSGVSAGTDAALYWVAKLHGDKEARRIQRLTEYQWINDANNDPYAAHFDL
ncbi:DJ-1/PfpI family protein [Shewanella sp. WXL01]|uniref:DJ-1/PfpI family protein n=1 Tax=Shewanella maritima TaxID=2520507 RepID=A0A411PJU2_9GAMM|nr:MULTISPECIES: DJ-1/PfpI family protein [Shewanella]NKF50875.1 DJ-1/PfpI family protein [Shewanella sp. WXL01]QBF83847.1 DJ-1/PfpI family protein [Shewanella maritima]